MTAAHPELLALLTLRFTPGLGPRRIEALRRHFGTAQAVLKRPLTELRAVDGLDQKTLAAIGTPKPGQRALQERALLRRWASRSGRSVLRLQIY